MSIIKSISYNQTEIIENILELHVPQGFIDVDPTYSKGLFYKNIKEPSLKFDINPQFNGIIKANAINLPLKNNSQNCIMFDPPFLATTGPSLKKSNESNKMAKRFGTFKTEIELHAFYNKSLKEFYRILKPNGILIFKCQDKVSSGKQYFTHNIIMMQALNHGYYIKDMFVLLAKNRLVAKWQKNQKHARKFHSYFLVFQKTKSKIDYCKFIGGEE